MLETWMLLAGFEGPWTLVTPVKVNRMGVGLYKNDCLVVGKMRRSNESASLEGRRTRQLLRLAAGHWVQLQTCRLVLQRSGARTFKIYIMFNALDSVVKIYATLVTSVIGGKINSQLGRRFETDTIHISGARTFTNLLYVQCTPFCNEHLCYTGFNLCDWWKKSTAN